MTFNSGEFLIFFPITLLLYFLLPKKWSRVSLLMMSLVFYLAWNVKLVFLILFTTAVSYFSAIIMEKTEKKSVKKLCLVVTLLSCLGVLFFFKYYNFAANSVGWALGAMTGNTYDFTLDLVLPVGISFYTFQTLSYVIDVYRGSEPVERDFVLFSLYVTFFPQLVAGPIERPGNLIPQLREKHPLTAENARVGLQKMAVGFFKKIVVADLLANYVNSVYNSASDATGWGVAIASLMFTVQIYCDFSGYTDIAIGCARIMGIKLMKNFDRPFKAQSIKEFWARWHISLSTWFRDYIYFPMGGSRRGRARQMFNIFIVFLVSGLWHGANWTFVIWGVLHALFRIVGELTAKPREALWAKMKIKTDAFWFVALRKTTTFLLVSFAFLFFRANSVSDIRILLGKLFTGWGSISGTLSSMGIGVTAAIVAVLSIIVMTELDVITSSDAAEGVVASSRKTTVLWVIWAVAVAWIMLLSVGGASTFIYFQF